MFTPAQIDREREARRGAEPAAQNDAKRTARTPGERLLRLQRDAGNRAATQLIQTKLKVGAANDPLEAEADRVADTLVDALQRSSDEEEAVPVTSADGAVVRATDEGSQAVVGLEGGTAPDSAVDAISRAGSGQPLPQQIARKAGGVLGADLSGVRVHTGEASQQAAQELGATAFTKGSDIHFAAGQYDPNSASGQKLLAHEVAHTVQQGGGAQRQVIRRMPTATAVKSTTGKKAKKGKKIFGKTVGATNNYSNLLAALQAHGNFITATEIAKDSKTVRAQVQRLHRAIDYVKQAAEGYLAKKDAEPAVAQICTELIANAPLEKLIVNDVMAHWQNNPTGISNLPNPKWYMQLPDDPRRYTFRMQGAAPRQMTANGKVAGGMNKKVYFGNDQEGNKGAFADDDVHGDYAGSAWDAPRGMIGDYGVKGDLRLGNRSIAMSRLDSLLKGGVIARTERGIKDEKIGTFQWEAQGDEMLQAMEAADKAGGQADLDEKEFARLLSRLQLIDAIAGQLDRHNANYFVDRDKKTGKITRVTGIDLDMAWMPNDPKARMHFDAEHAEDRYPGFSRYVDKEMAQAIIALQPGDLRAILIDLLTEPEIDAAVERLQTLQGLLKENTTQLLDPDDWDDMIRADMIKRGDGYFGRDVGMLDKR